MERSARTLLLLVLVMAGTVPAPRALAQAPDAGVACSSEDPASVMRLGALKLERLETEVRFAEVGRGVALDFVIPELDAGDAPTRNLYVGVLDQPFDMDMGLWRMPACEPVARWLGPAAPRPERRVSAFPLTQHPRVESLLPGEYRFVAAHWSFDHPPAATDFTARFPLSIVLGVEPPFCARLAPEPVPHPKSVDARLPEEIREDYAGLTQQNMTPGQYAFGLAVEPARPGRGALLSLSVTIWPNDSNLFDATWQIDDGEPLPTSSTIAHVPAAAIAATPEGDHTVRVILRGARRDISPEARLPLDGGQVELRCGFTIERS